MRDGGHLPLVRAPHKVEDEVVVPSSVDAVSESVRAELGAAVDAVGRYKARLASLVETIGPNHEDLISAMYEAERALVSAERLLARAEKLARG